MSLLQEAMDACAALTKRVKHLEYDKVAQALEITKLKRKVKKLEKMDDTVVLEDDKDEDREVADVVKYVEETKVDESAQDQERQVESQAEIYKIDIDHANKVLSMQEDKTKPAEVQEVVDLKFLLLQLLHLLLLLQELLLLLVEEGKEWMNNMPELHAELNKDIDWDEAIDHVKRKAKEDPAVKKY
nr:hypothetical protein [Tanacetum cinerariifolium]